MKSQFQAGSRKSGRVGRDFICPRSFESAWAHPKGARTSSRQRRAHPTRLTYDFRFTTRNPQSGFTLIELIIVITMVVILSTVFLDRVWFYQEQAEKTAMVEVAGAIQSALTMQHGRLLVRGMESEVTMLAADNPMRWLSKLPRNYSGEFYDPTPRSVAPGNWVFDLRSRELIYVLDRAEHFIPGKDGNKWIRYRVNLMYDPALGARDKNSKELVGSTFEPVEPYRWFD